jgi:hypothetical protein
LPPDTNYKTDHSNNKNQGPKQHGGSNRQRPSDLASGETDSEPKESAYDTYCGDRDVNDNLPYGYASALPKLRSVKQAN